METTSRRPRKPGWIRVEQLIREMHAANPAKPLGTLAFDACKQAAVEYAKQDLPSWETVLRNMKIIASKYPVEFRESRVGRKSEADFVFNGRLHNRDTSLVVVEVKAPATRGILRGQSESATFVAYQRQTDGYLAAQRDAGQRMCS